MHDLTRRLKQDAYAKADGGDVEVRDEWRAAVEIEAWHATFPQYEFDLETGHIRRKLETLPPWERPANN